MSKYKYVITVVVFAVVTAIGLVCLRTSRENGHRSQQKQENGVVLKADDEYNRLIRSQIDRKTLASMDSRGIQNYLSSTYRPDTPLVEIHCQKRDMDGKISPFPVSDLIIDSQDPVAGGGYGLNGAGLRLEIGSKEGETRNLLYGAEYTVYGIYHSPNDPPNLIRGRTSEVTFRTPASLGPGEMLKLDLVLVDEQKAKELAEQSKLAAERQKVIEEREAITVTLDPPIKSPSELVVCYSDGASTKEVSWRGHDKLILKGPNQLGGELLVFDLSADGKPRLWTYIGRLNDRQISLPKHAGMIVNERDLVTVCFDAGKALAEVWPTVKRLNLYMKQDSKIPLFFVLPPREEVPSSANPSVCVKVMPGKYHVRAVGEKGREIPLGPVEIDNKSNRRYTIDILTTGDVIDAK